MTGGASRLLPQSLVDRIESDSGASITSVVPRAGGGASRHGAQIELQWPTDRRAAAYLSYDSRAGDPRRTPFFVRETSVLRALSGPLADSGVRVPEFIAADPDHLALATLLVEGSDKAPSDPAEAEAVARDCVAQLAALHRIDPARLDLQGFGDVTQPTSERIRMRLDELRSHLLSAAPDPILLLALGWLEENIPVDTGPSVLLHGDAGPGNFLHRNGQVTALLDWELSHYGDPLEDLAQIWVRMLFQPFLPMREVFRAYEAAGGVSVDPARVRFHRLYFQIGFTVSSHLDVSGASQARSANLGLTLAFYTAHMRVIVRSLAELTGITLADVPLPDAAPTAADLSYAVALDDIREVIAPRATDQHAQAKAKNLARLIKFWRARDRYGAVFDAAEIAEVGAALKAGFGTVAEARAALATAIVERRIPFADALQVCHGRMSRDTAIMGDAMGALATTYFPDLEENR